MGDKEAKGERMFSSGGGVETESGKNVREAVQLGVEHMKTALAGGGVMEGQGAGQGHHLTAGWGDARRCGGELLGGADHRPHAPG